MKERTYCIPPVDPPIVDQVKEETPPKKEDKIILFVGPVRERKGVDDLINAFKLIVDKVPNSTLSDCGRRPRVRRPAGACKKFGTLKIK